MIASERDDRSQQKRFREAARELETDDRENAFDRALKRIASNPPAPDPNPDVLDKPKG